MQQISQQLSNVDRFEADPPVFTVEIIEQRRQSLQLSNHTLALRFLSDFTTCYIPDPESKRTRRHCHARGVYVTVQIP